MLKEPRCLGVLLCYNDGDILEDAILHLLNNNHSLIVWDHGSTDDTPAILQKYKNKLLELKTIPRSLNFYKIYPAMSQNLISNYIKDYDWVSWPDQDEILEGPDRKESYYNHIVKICHSEYNWIQFNNFNYWFTERDRQDVISPIKRIKYYSLFSNCAPKIRSWRASATNIRVYNHNALPGKKCPIMFNLRHYSMRNREQMERRLNKDRAGIRRGKANVHYINMNKHPQRLIIKSEDLHYDDENELSKVLKFNWDKIYY